MEQANIDIRNEAKEAGVKLWEIAEAYGINDGNFSRLLRRELPSDKKEHMRRIISNILQKRGNNGNAENENY